MEQQAFEGIIEEHVEWNNIDGWFQDPEWLIVNRSLQLRGPWRVNRTSKTLDDRKCNLPETLINRIKDRVQNDSQIFSSLNDTLNYSRYYLNTTSIKVLFPDARIENLSFRSHFNVTILTTRSLIECEITTYHTAEETKVTELQLAYRTTGCVLRNEKLPRKPGQQICRL